MRVASCDCPSLLPSLLEVTWGESLGKAIKPESKWVTIKSWMLVRTYSIGYSRQNTGTSKREAEPTPDAQTWAVMRHGPCPVLLRVSCPFRNN